ncbi:hypothetical protein [Planctomicrobium sp. SH664]|uniref:hypothetical protein n=1 Tax=Planctomicrobium sp. SH664 TaxID=3448125 RepID=UPI003F5C8FC0
MTAVIAKNRYTVKQASQMLGLAEVTVRLHCRNGNCPGAEYHEFPGTSRGYYTLTEKSVKWLRENVRHREREPKQQEAAEVA